ncbi:PC4 domain-containing protein [Trichonephila clavipes]|nr:PC4 domain-containing protein [Trichonephila clavipes]
MKRMFNSNNGSNKRVCFSERYQVRDSSFSDDTIPPHHFHLGQDVYGALTYFATMVQVHLRLCKRDGNNRLFPTKRGVCFLPMLWQSFVNQIEQINTSSVEETILIKDSLMISTVFIENIPNIIFQRYFQKKDHSKKFVPETCVLSENNWLELQRIHKNIRESVMLLTFDRMLRNFSE